MRLVQAAQLHRTEQQVRLTPIDHCSGCATPCGRGMHIAQPLQALIPEHQLNLSAVNGSLQLDSPAALISQAPLAVTISLEARALNSYAAFIFGTPLAFLFLLALLADFNPISTPSQLAWFFLTVALVLLIVTLVCRSVATGFESRLRLETRPQNPHKQG